MIDELVKALFSAPLATVFVIAGLIFLLVAVVGNISGKIEPGPKGRIFSGMLELAFVIAGLAIHFAQKPDQAVVGTSKPIIPKAGEQIAAIQQDTISETANQKTASPIVTTGAEIIEAGCGFSAAQIEGEFGSAHLVACPARSCPKTAFICTDLL